ncbi:signal peptidase II [Corynebacterium resistens]|uniref:signal peptidase II n=1 Tax=Corynebacterium resistens TaxID=258224 RepID=UPI002354B261|nr:signal peptidase II [Corynebacterium resistens]
MTSKRASLLAVSLMLATVAIDQLSKWAVVENLEPNTSYPVLGEWFRLYLVRNPGAAFSFGTDATVVFSCIQIAAVALCLFLAFRAKSWWSFLPIGLIGGGAAGNLIDRIFRYPGNLHGHVVDFFSFGSFAIFNVADSAITVGVALYLFYTVFIEPRRSSQPERKAQREGEGFRGEEAQS